MSVSDTSPFSLICRTNVMLSSVKNWFVRNRLTLNECKTHFFVFYRKQRANPFLNNVYLGGSVMKRVNSVKFLGLQIDDYLIWHHHVKHFVKVLSKYVSTLLELKAQLNESPLLLMCNSLVYHIVLYCQRVWGFMNYTLLNKIFILQEKNMRVTGKAGHLEPAGSIFTAKKLLDAYSSIIFVSVILFHKYFFLFTDICSGLKHK